MERPAAVREGAREVLRDVEPEDLRRHVFETIDDSWTAPGVVTVLAARKVGVEEVGADLERRAVGTQLIYEGLSVTRRLVHEEPWAAGADDDANVDVLLADVLVARGAHLLAYTEAADNCVEVIQRFGRQQTAGDAGPDADCSLEADALELAAVAGSTVAAPRPAPQALDWAESLAETLEPGNLPDVSTFVPSTDVGAAGAAAVAKEGRQSSTDP